MQRYFGIKKDNNYLYLLDSDYHHIKNVMRNSDGDLIEVVVDGKMVATGTGRSKKHEC